MMMKADVSHAESSLDTVMNLFIEHYLLNPQNQKTLAGCIAGMSSKILLLIHWATVKYGNFELNFIDNVYKV